MKKLSRSAVLALNLALLGIAAVAQQTASKPPHVEVPTIDPRPEDVASIDGIIHAYYDVISGPAGQPRQWSRDRTLYIPDIRFVAMTEDKSGHPQAHIASHQQFVDASNPSVVKEGFYESEIHRVTEKFGNIAHVFSTYESRTKANGPVIARGINALNSSMTGTAGGLHRPSGMTSGPITLCRQNICRQRPAPRSESAILHRVASIKAPKILCEGSSLSTDLSGCHCTARTK